MTLTMMMIVMIFDAGVATFVVATVSVASVTADVTNLTNQSRLTFYKV